MEAPLLMVYPISDIHKRIQLLRHTSVDIESTVPANEWLRLHLLLPDCGSVSSIAIHTNDTDTWAELRGVSCARSKKSREVAIFIGLGAGCGALVILLMALRVSQWTYVVYDTSERMRRRYACAAYFVFSLFLSLSNSLSHSYEQLRQYVPLPEGPAPLTEEFMRDLVREEHEEEME